MRRFLSFLLTFFLLLGPVTSLHEAFAQTTGSNPVVTVVVAPNPVANNRTAYLIAFGCPDGQVTFSWVKNDTDSGTAFSNNRIAIYRHDDYDVGSYSLFVNCGGVTKRSSFTSVSVTGTGWGVNFDDASKSYVCHQVQVSETPNTTPLFDSESACTSTLSQIRSRLGNHYYNNGGVCMESPLLPPSKDPSKFTYYSTLQTCIDAQSTTKYEIATDPTGGAICKEAANGPYPSRDACENALRQQYAFYIFIPSLPTESAYCISVKNEDVPPNTTTYDSKEECDEARIAGRKWRFFPPAQVITQGRVCYQTSTNGGYDSEKVCLAAFCQSIEEEGIGAFQAIYDQYCDALEEILTITPTPKPTDPPPQPPCYEKETVTDPGQGATPRFTHCYGVYTGLGMSIKTDPALLIKDIFSILLSLSGGIAILLIIRSGYQLMISRGDAEQVKEARERLTSAIVGLLFIIFSLVILEVIGVDILHIPGLSK